MLTPKQITTALLPSLEAITALLPSLEATTALLPSLRAITALLPSLERRGRGWLTLAALPLLPLHAQDTLLLRDYAYVKSADPWLTQLNAAALSRFATRNIANADLSLTTSGGRLTPSYGSPSVLDVAAGIESFYRLDDRIVFFGAISYDNWTGRDMSGSAFLHLPGASSSFPSPSSYTASTLPSYGEIPSRLTLFDIVEDSPANEGRKHRDTYRLTGAASYAIADALALGARLDYTAANYAKYKDLRHQNKLSDLTATAGLYCSPLAAQPSLFTVGANYTYHRQTESLQFSVNGKSEKVYKSLIDYGASLGLVEQFGNEGYTDKSREMPLFEDSHGGALQLEVRPASEWTAFAALTLSHATGYYGRLSPYTITYTNHRRNILTLEGRLTYAPFPGTSRYNLDLHYTNEHLTNAANTFRALTNDNGATYYEYYDPTETADKRRHDLAIGYTMHLGIRGERPTWTVAATYHRQQRNTTAYLFPQYRQQRLTTHEVTAGVTRHIVLPSSVLTLNLNAAYLTGSGAPYQDGTFPSPTTQQPSPTTQQPSPTTTFLYRDHHLLTAAQWGVGMQASYTFRFPGTALLTYVRAAACYRHSASTSYDTATADSPSRTTATFAIGCTF